MIFISSLYSAADYSLWCRTFLTMILYHTIHLVVFFLQPDANVLLDHFIKLWWHSATWRWCTDGEQGAKDCRQVDGTDCQRRRRSDIRVSIRVTSSTSGTLYSYRL